MLGRKWKHLVARHRSTDGRQRRRRSPSRKPTYGTATRLARIIYGLLSRPYGWSFDAIQEEIGISPRTLRRYIAVCRREFVDRTERPLLEIVRRGDRQLLRLAESARAPDSTPYQALSLYFALSVLQVLDGTVLKDGVEDLWQRFYRMLPHAQQQRLADFEKKFFSVPYALKDYRAFDDTLDLIVRCLVDQQRMRIDYGGLLGEGHVHEFDPYTLALYRGGLYLIGHSHRFEQVIYLAVERIKKAEKLDARFTYPARYSPEKYTQGTFGIIDGPESSVELLILNPETAAYLSSRRLHPTQQFHSRRDGKTLLNMRVRGTTELATWVLSLGPYVKVLRPKALRDVVAAQLKTAAGLYP